MSELASQSIPKIEKDTPPLSNEALTPLLTKLNGWEPSADQKMISREFRFKNYYQTITFVNAIAWIANQADHHPDMEVGYNRCLVQFSTHFIGGLSMSDFICAARIDQLDAG